MRKVSEIPLGGHGNPAESDFFIVYVREYDLVKGEALNTNYVTWDFEAPVGGQMGFSEDIDKALRIPDHDKAEDIRKELERAVRELVGSPLLDRKKIGASVGIYGYQVPALNSREKPS